MLTKGLAYEKLGQHEEARAAFLRVKVEAEALSVVAPNDPSRHRLLSSALAYLGEKDAAITQAKRAVELSPESVDAFEGPDYTAGLARVYAITGEKERAIELLDGLLSRPSGLTVPIAEMGAGFR